eukprot:m.480929 g.480929  ORF g.480929 m.480929 type:complete len:82 (+) comp21712_c0_seq4:775-1020(+)
MIREQIEILQAAVEDEQGASTVTIGGQSMTLERLEEAYRMLTMEEWKFVYIESDDRNAFVNCTVGENDNQIGTCTLLWSVV